MDDSFVKFCALLKEQCQKQTLKKLVISRFDDENTIRCEGRLIKIKGVPCLQLEYFKADGKALHINYPFDGLEGKEEEILGSCRQANIITTSGDAELKKSKHGKYTFLNRIKSPKQIDIAFNDRSKNRIFREGEVYPFLVKLGVTDKDGKVIERKGAKYRQIDRFLQYVDEIYGKLGNDDEMFVLDLCCGKSYLTFAVYWFLTEVKQRKVSMLGIDLKKDVIAYCSETARELGYAGLSFKCMDINEYIPPKTPDLVLSLHACDIATDIVLTTAAKLNAKVILSTPCCQHEIMGQLSRESEAGIELGPIFEHSLLKQKFAVALTDALRCKRLQANGYSVDVTELVDPEDTPKNLIIRAFKTKMSDSTKEKYREEFEHLSEYCSVNIFGGI